MGDVFVGTHWIGVNMKRIKGNIIYSAIWLTGILSFILASGAPHKWNGGG